MITTYQVGLIKEVTQYVSTCSGVYCRKNQVKPWGAVFHLKELSVPLGSFSTEEEAIQAYKNYHENYYQGILAKIKQESEEEFGTSDSSKIKNENS